MKIYDFPSKYAADRKEVAQQQIRKENSYSDDRQRQISNQVSHSVTFDDILLYAISGGTIGFCIGFFVCCGTALEDAELGTSVGVWLMLTFLGILLGIVWFIICKIRHKSTKSNAEGESVKERFRRDKAIRMIEDQTDKDVAIYKSEFEAEAQRMSVNFAESALATEVIEWMSVGFSAAITAADRAEHIEKVVVPFCFKIYTDKIVCDRGVYDFKVKRCANLTSPLQQAALARAIASAIHLNIIMEYPSDTSGTEHMITTNYEYTSCSVEVTITYTAPNGNYRPVQNW